MFRSLHRRRADAQAHACRLSPRVPPDELRPLNLEELGVGVERRPRDLAAGKPQRAGNDELEKKVQALENEVKKNGELEKKVQALEDEVKKNLGHAPPQTVLAAPYAAPIAANNHNEKVSKKLNLFFLRVRTPGESLK